MPLSRIRPKGQPCTATTRARRQCTREATENGLCLQHGGTRKPLRPRFCVRCATRRGELHIHHVIASADGGTDDPKNLEYLCRFCHDEWHQRFEGQIEWEQFKQLPPIRFFAQVWSTPDIDSTTVEQLRNTWRWLKAQWIAEAKEAID